MHTGLHFLILLVGSKPVYKIRIENLLNHCFINNTVRKRIFHFSSCDCKVSFQGFVCCMHIKELLVECMGLYFGQVNVL